MGLLDASTRRMLLGAELALAAPSPPRAEDAELAPSSGRERMAPLRAGHLR